MHENSLFFYTKKQLRDKPRVFKINKKYYLKQNNERKLHTGHRLQKLLYKITKNPIVYPTVPSSKVNLILFESNILEKMAKSGLNVPKVVYKTKNYYVMEDTGKNFVEIIEESNDKEKVNTLVKKALESLVELHKKGFAKGGSQLRNFTLKDNKVYMIDFEEEIEEKYVKELQIRDVILFLLSLEKYKVDYNLEEILDYYEKISKNVTTKTEIKKFFHSRRWIRFLNSKIFNKIRMNDVRDFLKLLEKCEHLQ